MLLQTTFQHNSNLKSNLKKVSQIQNHSFINSFKNGQFLENLKQEFLYVLTCSPFENRIFKFARFFILSNLAFFNPNSSALGCFCNLKKVFQKQLCIPKVIHFIPLYSFFFSLLEISTIFLRLRFFFECLKSRICHTIFTIKLSDYSYFCWQFLVARSIQAKNGRLFLTRV